MYSKPDVSVFIDLEANSFDVPTPSLWPCMVGEHYHVVRDAYAGFAKASEAATLSYPDLPSSFNDSEQDLEVDIESEFAPKAEMVLDATGERVDVTDMMTFNPTSIEKPVINETHDGVPYTGALFISYRALSDEYAGINTQLLKASSTEELTRLFGENGIAPANPLGFAMFKAIEHGQVAVSGVAVGSVPAGDGSGTYRGTSFDLPIGYQYALDFLKGQDVHSIVPLTHDTFVLDAVLQHAEYMSGPEGKNERHVFFAPSLDKWWPVRSESDGVGLYFPVTASTVAGQTVLNDGTDPNVQETPVGYEFEAEGYRILRVGSGDGSQFGTFALAGSPDLLTSGPITIGGETIDTAVQTADVDGDGTSGPTFGMYLDLGESVFSPSNQRLRLSDAVRMEGVEGDPLYVQELGVGGMQNLVFVASETMTMAVRAEEIGSKRITFFREKSGYDVVEGIRDMGRAYSNDRLTMIGPDWLSANVGGTDTDVRSFYAAAQLAGEVCQTGRRPAGVVPGANGLTGLRDSIEEPFKSSRYFTEEQLDVAAGGGFTWLVNDQKGLPVRTRHLLTTDMSSIEARETILSVERDFLARTFRAALRTDLQRYRIDDSLLQTLTLKATSIAQKLTDPDSQSRCFRQITIQQVEQDPNRPDTVNIAVEATHLYPLNNIKVTVKVVV